MLRGFKEDWKSCFDSKDISEYKIEDWSGKVVKSAEWGRVGKNRL